MVVILCKFCGDGVEIRAWRGHLIGEKHRGNLPSKIVVEGKFESAKIDDVHEYFAKFGSITKKKVLSRNRELITLIEYCFEDPMSYSTIAHKQHLFGGQQLDISWSKMYDSEYSALISKITNALREQTLPFAQQIATLQEILQTDSQIAASRDQILDDLTTTLNETYPNSKVHLFGSTDLDLDIPGSTLDFYIDNVNLTTMTEETLRLHQTVICRCGKFDNVFLTNREFPKIECRHIETQTGCILSIHRAVIRNTELIKYYLNLDAKIRPLILLLKFWGKCHHLVEAHGFSNYVLCLLVIFYLQQEPYKLPAVVDLREEKDMWRCTFTHGFKSLENATIFELVSGFLKFYDTFDYVSYVVAPFSGLALEKTCFLEPYLLPPCYNLYMDAKKTLDVDCGLCVQDPFDHSSNLLKGTLLTTGGNFTSQCRNSLTTGVCPYLTTMLRVYANPHFTINKLEGFSDDEWTSSVRKVTSTILDTICSLQLKITKINSNHYIYNCTGHFADLWKDRVFVLNDLLRELSLGTSEMCKEIDVTTKFMQKRVERKQKPNKCNIVIESKFEKKPCRVEFCFKKLGGDTHFEHYFRVKMMVFLKEMVTKKCLSTIYGAKIAQDQTGDESLNLDSDAVDSAYTPPPKSDENLSSKATEDESKQIGLIGNAKTKKKRSVSKSISLSPDRRCERFKKQSRSRSRSYGRNKDNFKTKKQKLNQRRSSSSSDSRYSRSPERGRSKSHHKSRSRSRSYGRNKDTEKSRNKKLKRNYRSPSSSSDTEHFRTRRRRCSKEQLRSRSRSHGRNKSKSTKKQKRNYSRSTSSDSEYSYSSYRSRKRSNRSSSKECRKKLLEQRKTFLEEVREKLKEVSKPVIPSTSFLCNLPIYQVPQESPILVVPSSQVAFHAAPHVPRFAAIVPRPPISGLAPPCEQSHGTANQQDTNTVDEVLNEMATVTTTRKEGEELVQEQKDKIMLQCFKTVKVISTLTSKRLHLLSSREANSKPPGHLSPLRNSQVKFRFTSASQDRKKFEEILLDILHSVEICNEPNDIPKLLEAVVEVLGSGVAMDRTTAARILQISLLGAMQDCKSKDFVEVGTQCCRTKTADKQVGTDDLNRVVFRDPRTYAPYAFLLGRGRRKIEETNGFVDGGNNILGPSERKAGYEEILY